MMKLAISAALAALLLATGAVSAQTHAAPAISDMSSQVSVTESRRGGVRVQVGPRHSRRASDVRRHGRGISARRGARRCETIKTTRRVRGRTVTRTVRRCR